ncbi:MAG: hypothetical protein RDU89_10090 [bacterium]|nr:hypothetical protein [bacterium]
MSAYRRECWLTAICFILVTVFGGILSVVFVLGKDLFFGPEPVYAAKSHVVGLPTHYVFLLVGSWLIVTAVGVFYAWYMDRLERAVERGEAG